MVHAPVRPSPGCSVRRRRQGPAADELILQHLVRRARDLNLTRRAGAQLFSVTENIEEASGRLVEGINALMAEFYSANLAGEIPPPPEGMEVNVDLFLARDYVPDNWPGKRFLRIELLYRDALPNGEELIVTSVYRDPSPGQLAKIAYLKEALVSANRGMLIAATREDSAPAPGRRRAHRQVDGSSVRAHAHLLLVAAHASFSHGWTSTFGIQRGHPFVVIHGAHPGAQVPSAPPSERSSGRPSSPSAPRHEVPGFGAVCSLVGLVTWTIAPLSPQISARLPEPTAGGELALALGACSRRTSGSPRLLLLSSRS
jgi:hypothetical protein